MKNDYDKPLKLRTDWSSVHSAEIKEEHAKWRAFTRWPCFLQHMVNTTDYFISLETDCITPALILLWLRYNGYDLKNNVPGIIKTGLTVHHHIPIVSSPKCMSIKNNQAFKCCFKKMIMISK